MPTKFDDYLREIEEKIKAEGPEAVARWEAFNTHFAMARDEPEISCADAEAEAVAAEQIRSGAAQLTQDGETALAELGIDVCQH
jgi:excisionase family DNA binding protein